jgi:hypothetical protein
MRNDPWEAIELLDQHSENPFFIERWRAVLRECAALLVPRLPPEAESWMAVADAYDQGRLHDRDLLAARAEALHFHDGRRRAGSAEELSGLRAVMYRLWPKEITSDWYESAWHFFHFCETAGLTPEVCFLFLEKYFAEAFE